MNKPHIWMTKVGVLRTNPEAIPPQTPQFAKLDAALRRIHNNTPMHLTTLSTDREAMLYAVQSKWAIVQRKAKEAMIKALEDSKTIDPPIRESSQYEKLAFTDEFSTLKCKANSCVYAGKVYHDKVTYSGGVYAPSEKPEGWVGLQHPHRYHCDFHRSVVTAQQAVTLAHPNKSINTWQLFHYTKGKEYEVRQGKRSYQEPFTRVKSHYNPEEKELYSLEHDMMLQGTDTEYWMYDNDENKLQFVQHADNYNQVQEMFLWDIFEEPDVPTVKEIHSDEYHRAMSQLDTMEALQGFSYYKGQKEYIARVSCLDSALIAAETGCGKSLIAISLINLKDVDRVLLISPKGTVDDKESRQKADHNVAQWAAELRKFGVNHPVYVISKQSHIDKLIKEHGELPKGVYLSWPEALITSNGAFEAIPASWSNMERENKTRVKMGYPLPDPDDEELDEDVPERLSVGIGSSFNGVRCVSKPSLLTSIGNIWDMVIFDEAHKICNLEAQSTKAIIRLEPPYRYALTATPIPNSVEQLFSLMGWLCVPRWHYGGISNKRWPYTIDDLGSFRQSFCAYERDLTDEDIKARKGVRNPRSVKTSPIVSQPSRLLKLLKPSMAYISKKECNPDMEECTIHTTKVPMGAEQFYAYTHVINPANMPFAEPRTIQGVMQTWLRTICAAPTDIVEAYNKRAKLKPDDPDIISVSSNYNPKTVAILQKIYECIAEGEQVVHVSARVGQSSELERRLSEAGIEVSRIDSTRSNHAKEAAKFKSGKTKVMLMGIKCAQSYSFEQCSNLIIGSLEWSYGTFNQAQGRVWRLNSPRPINIYIILHHDTIEELLFDKLGLKEDTATICLRGEHVPRQVNAVHPDEIMANHLFNFNKNAKNISEVKCEEDWPILRHRLEEAINVTK